MRTSGNKPIVCYIGFLAEYVYLAIMAIGINDSRKGIYSYKGFIFFYSNFLTQRFLEAAYRELAQEGHKRRSSVSAYHNIVVSTS